MQSIRDADVVAHNIINDRIIGILEPAEIENFSKNLPNMRKNHFSYVK